MAGPSSVLLFVFSRAFHDNNWEASESTMVSEVGIVWLTKKGGGAPKGPNNSYSS